MKRSTRILGSLFTLVLLVVSLLGTAPVEALKTGAVTYMVSSLADSGPGTLRQAITDANANVNTGTETDTIKFSLSGTITPVTALPFITGNLVIDGTGFKVVLNGNNSHRLLHIVSGIVVVNNLTIQNGLNPTLGGGIRNAGTLTVTNSTFINNKTGASGIGGAIVNLGSLTIANSTFTGNTANLGGGVYNGGTPLSVYNSTFSGNGAPGGGGAVYNETGATMNLANTILANSTGGGDCANPPGGIISSNFNNIIEDGSCPTTRAVDPQLDVLAENGGFTKTMALTIDSPAREAGDPTVCANPPVNALDQRGVARPRGPLCDIGAFEAIYASNITIDPNPLNFGEVVINTTSPAVEVFVRYVGTTGSITFVGPFVVAGEFSLDDGPNTCVNLITPVTLSTGDSCSFFVSFSPLSVGPKTGSVTINHTGLSSPEILVLTGIGVDPQLGLSTTFLPFSTYVDTTSLSRGVVVTNTGTGTLIIGELLISGDFILHSDKCTNAKLAAGKTCVFKVAFAPQSPGTHTGEIRIPSNASNFTPAAPAIVILRGTTKAGTQLLKMGNFDHFVSPLPWIVSTPSEKLVSIHDCVFFRSPFCSARFQGSNTFPNPTISAVQVVRYSGSAGDNFYISLSSRSVKVPIYGQYKLIVSFYSPTGLIETKTYNFQSGTHAFQTIGVNYVVPAAYNRILFNFTFQNSSGYAWFDDAMLILLP